MTAAEVGVDHRVGIELAPSVAWQLLQAISPRETVRVPGLEASGALTLRYDQRYPIYDAAPDRPWAVNLADDSGRFHLLGFDLDAHCPDQAAQAAGDCDRFSTLLTRLRIPHLVTASSGVANGGRHIWISLQTGLEPYRVQQLADYAQLLYPSLDKAPLCNPASGCLRSPGAPHRNGHQASILRGRIEVLTDPRRAMSPHQVAELLDVLAAEADRLPIALNRDKAAAAALPRDEDGQPYLPGRQRLLPARVRESLDQPVDAQTDASTRLFSIFVSCAHARMHYRDVAQLATKAPGLEHARSMRGSGGAGQRTPRPQSPRNSASTAQVVKRQWLKAVAFAAQARPSQTEDFEQLAAPVTAFVRAVQQDADVTPGRWTTGSGPSARRVLDCLCVWALDSLKLTLDASLRHLADSCGISHETARCALQTLAEYGLVTRKAESVGLLAATYEMTPPPGFHRDSDGTLTHAVPGAGSPGVQHGWDALRTTLRTRLHQETHDAFHPHALGIGVGNALAHGLLKTEGTCARLARYGLVEGAVARSQLDEVAEQRKVAGCIERRRIRHQREREQFCWWAAELERLRDRFGPDRLRPDGKPWAVYPRDEMFRPRHAEALRLVTLGSAASPAANRRKATSSSPRRTTRVVMPSRPTMRAVSATRREPVSYRARARDVTQPALVPSRC